MNNITWQYIAGFFDGEGCLCQTKIGDHGHAFIVDAYQNFITAKQNKNGCFDYAKSCLEKLGVSFSVGWHSKERPHCGVFRITGGLTNVLQFLGKIRPKRLLDQIDISKLGTVRRTDGGEVTRLLSIKPVGIETVYGLETTSSTYISEGFLSHNSKFGVRQCEGVVNTGLLWFDIYDGTDLSNLHWQFDVPDFTTQKVEVYNV